MKYFFYSYQSLCDGKMFVGNGVQAARDGLFNRDVVMEDTNDPVVVLFFQEISKEQYDFMDLRGQDAY